MLFDVFLVILFLALAFWLFVDYKEKEKTSKPYQLDLDVHVYIDKEGKVNTEVTQKGEKPKKEAKQKVIPIEEPNRETDWLNINAKDSNL